MTPHVWALLFYALLTIAYTWPVATGLDHLVPHDLGDPLLSTWTLWWNARVVPFTSQWWDGLAFYPARDTLTYSDHRVGLGLITSPIIWLGGAPLAAHNVAFLLSFFLSACAAYALCFSLTKSRAAAFIGGLVFGFNPYRAAHLPHLELLSSYWLPLVLLGLHRWAATLGPRWLALTSVALTMQGITSGYYFAFLGVLIALWLVWFTPRNLAFTHYLRLALALTLPALLVAPIFLSYRNAHRTTGLSRGILEIEMFSADVIGLLTTPRLLRMWSSPESWWQLEGELWPGAIAVVLVAAALWLGRGSTAAALPPWGRRLRATALVAAVVLIGVSFIPGLFGPVVYQLPGFRISVSGFYKPLSLVVIFGGTWALTTSRVRQAFHAQSPLAFYALATIAMWLFAFGPTARFLGERVLYKAPYSWLMMLPGFGEGFRVPARFAMLATLTLAVAAGVAFYRLTRRSSPRLQLIATVMAAALIAAESWIEPLPAVPAPAALAIPEAVPIDAAVLELPFGVYEDTAAMYRSIYHGRRVVNGMSGFEPPHYIGLKAAIDEGRYDALQAIAASSPIAIFVSRDPNGAQISARLGGVSGVRSLATTALHEILLLERTLPQPAVEVVDRPLIPVQRFLSPLEQEKLQVMVDGNRDSVWVTNQPQAGTEFFVADLGAPTEIETLVLAQGAGRLEFARALAIELSEDATHWAEVWRGNTATLAIAAAVTDPREIQVHYVLGRHRTRYLRIRQLGQSHFMWGLAEFRVYGPRR